MIITLITDRGIFRMTGSALAPPVSHAIATNDISPAEIDRRLAAYVEMSHGAFSPNTIRAVASDTRIFSEWCADTGHHYGPPSSTETVAAFIDAMATTPAEKTGKTRKPATVARYVASIDHLHRALDLPPPGQGNASKLALRRMRRERGTRQQQAKALRWSSISKALNRMAPDMAAGDLLSLRDAAMIALAYDTLARASELVAINADDVQQDVDGCTCFIARSKTDQEGEGDYRFVAESTYGHVRTWIDAAGLEKGEPLFIPIGFNGRNDRLSTGDVSAIFQRRCGDRFSAHSTRVGAAQDAKAAGASTGAIQQAGGWKSERMVARYTEKLATKESAAAMLAAAQGR